MSKKTIPTHDPQTGQLNPRYEELTGKPNPLAPVNNINQELITMSHKEWRKFSELQYIRGRLDEQYKLLNLVDLDLHDSRMLDARISKYLSKMRKVDPMAYELYRIEKENISRTVRRKSKS